MSDNLPVPLDYGKRAVRQDQKAGPLTSKDLRSGLMEAAGVTKEELGAMLRKAIDTTVKQMDAVDAQTFAYQGKAGDTVYKENNVIQLKAAELALKFVDQMPRASKDTGPKTASVIINLPNIYTPEFLSKDKKPIIINTEGTHEDTQSGSDGSV